MWTDGRTDVTKLIVDYRNFVNAPNDVTTAVPSALPFASAHICTTGGTLLAADVTHVVQTGKTLRDDARNLNEKGLWQLESRVRILAALNTDNLSPEIELAADELEAGRQLKLVYEQQHGTERNFARTEIVGQKVSLHWRVLKKAHLCVSYIK